MKRIPISAARRIAEEYGYDQVIIVARKVGEDPNPHSEHMTTYGVNKAHCYIAASCGNYLQRNVMGWRLDAELNGEHGQRAQRYEAELDNQRLRAELMIVTADRDTLLRTFAKPMAPLGDSVRSPPSADTEQK